MRGRRLTLEPLEDRRVLSILTPAVELFGVSPALFVENQGQWADEQVRFLHQGEGANVAMTDAGVVFDVFRSGAGGRSNVEQPGDALPRLPDHLAHPGDGGTEVLQFSAGFVGANTVAPIGLQESATVFNYFVGEEAHWRGEVPSYEVVAYEGLYDGIDLRTWGLRSSLKYEFHVAPGADFAQIAVRYDGIAGLSTAEDGSLLVDLGGDWGTLTDDAPYIYQVIGGREVEVAGRFELLDAYTYTFAITDQYDESIPLIIDPNLAWSTHLGGTGGSEQGRGIAVDAEGNVLVTGTTWSRLLPKSNYSSFSSGGNANAFVAKFSPNGSLEWFCFVGGTNEDRGIGIAVDMVGDALLTGWTDSSDFSGANNAYQGGEYDAFVAKVSSAGELQWATYLGGSNNDAGTGIAVDGAGDALVTGTTRSSDFAGTNNAHYGWYDAFVAKVSSHGVQQWATYLGGGDWDAGEGIAVDAAGNALVTGATSSPDFAWANNAYQGGYSDAFVAKVSSDGVVQWVTYLGGSDLDNGVGVAVDAAGNALVTGETYSIDFGGANNWHYGGAYHAFVAKVSSAGELQWATYLGGTGAEFGAGIAVDAAGDALVTGKTASIDFAGANNAYQGGQDAFVAKVSSAGVLQWATYLGGSGLDHGRAIVVDAAGNALVTGHTESSDFFGANNAYIDRDAFVAKVSSDGVQQWATYLGGGDSNGGYDIAVDATGNVFVTGQTDAQNFPGATNTPKGDKDAFVAKFSPEGVLQWTTYLGGTGHEWGSAIAVDAAGNALVTGVTSSIDFAGANNAYGGDNDAFVAKVSSAGELQWATYLGGSGWDGGADIAVDAAGNALVTGYTFSDDFNGANNSRAGVVDAFVAKISPGGALLGASYLGGTGDDWGEGIAADAAGNFLVTGFTMSNDLPGATNWFGGQTDAFVAKFSSAGVLQWTTYVGGSSSDIGRAIVVDAAGNVLVTGSTYSSDFPEANNAHSGSWSDVFVVQLSPAGAIVWSTFLGGTTNHLGGIGYDGGFDIAVDAAGNALVTGTTSSIDFSGATNFYMGGYSDAFVAKISATGQFEWASYLGGGGGDNGCAIAVDTAGHILVAGTTYSTDFPGPNDIPKPGGHVFLVKIPVEVLANPAFIGVHRVNTFYLDYNGNGRWDSGMDTTYRFGNPGDTPIIGDWNGDGISQIGVWRSGTFYLDYNGNGRWDSGDVALRFGNTTDTPIVGDWNGDGISQIGVHRGNTFYLDYNGNGRWDSGDVVLRFGNTTDTPIVGDWNGDGSDQIGVWRAGLFYLDYDGDGRWDSAVDKVFRFGLATDTPIVGDWNSDGRDQIGVWRAGVFYLDYDGDGRWDRSVDRSFRFGNATDTPIIGKWAGPLGGQALHATGMRAPMADMIATGPVLDYDALAPVVSTAIAAWTTVPDLGAEQLNPLYDVRFVLTDLPGTMLALTRYDTIYLDFNAAGHGWYLDPNGADFQPSTRLGELEARPGTDAVHRIDLLTAVMHEMGHLLGYEHAESGLMQPTLGPGIRRLPMDREDDAGEDWADLLDDRSLQPDRLDAYFATL